MMMVDKEYGGVCGFGQYWEIMFGQVYLGCIIVLLKLWGIGLGKQLGQLLVVVVVKDIGVGIVMLCVYCDNIDVVCMYVKFGFVLVFLLLIEELVFMKLQVKCLVLDDMLCCMV